MNISVRQFLDRAREYYEGQMMVLCALGAAMKFAQKAGITGIGTINITGMPPATSGAAFLRLLNPRLSEEQATRWYNQIICRNDCQRRRSRAWSTLKRAVLMGEHYRFVPIGSHFRPEFVVPDMSEITEVTLFDTADAEIGCDHPELLEAVA